MMPDLFHWLLCGEATNERTNASTTQFYNPSTGDWAYDLLRRLDLPPALLGTIIEAGAPLGPLLPWVAEETGLPQAQVVAPATHDTASAVLAVPGDPSGDWCYISCGTWSLLGAELDRPVLTDRCLELNFTNEVGAGGTIRLLKNIAGMWLLQETRRCWAAAGRALGWQELNRLAASAPALTTLIDPDHPALLAPANMIDAIGQVCHSTGQSPPQSDGALVRCILESLALKYRYVLEALEQLLQRRISTIHLIGGGSQNRLLCQFAANACGRRVLAGPVEATAAGNGLVQAIACGTLSSVADARAVVRASFALDEFLPADRQRWDEAYGRFVSLVEAQRAS
jgi:rhamnulokinase